MDGEGHVYYATILGNLAGVLEVLGQYEEAKEGYQKALEIYKKNYGEDRVEYATFLGCLAGV